MERGNFWWFCEGGWGHPVQRLYHSITIIDELFKLTLCLFMLKRGLRTVTTLHIG